MFPGVIFIVLLWGGEGIASAAIEVTNLEIPETFGLWASMQWCTQGLMPALQRVATTLMNHNISADVIEAIKTDYFDTAPLASHPNNNALPTPTSPLQSMLSMAPLVSDILLGGPDDHPQSMTLTDKMQSYANRICRLSDTEADLHLLLDNRSPLSCALIDLTHTLVACGATQANHLPTSTVQCIDGPVSVPFLPTNTVCDPSPDTLQAKEGLTPFVFEDFTTDIPLRLHPLDQIPNYIPAHIRQDELLTYLTLFRAAEIISNLAEARHDHTRCALAAIQSTNIIPGWDVTQLYNSIEAAAPDVGGIQLSTPQVIPHALFFRRRSARCTFAVGVRGSKTLHEWTSAFDMTRKEYPLINGTHAGALTFVSRLLPAVIATLEREAAAQQCECDDTTITFFGHSFGASLSQVLSLAVGQHLKMENACGAQVNGVFFAPLRMFNRSQVKVYRKVINSRHIIDVNDALYHLPCFEGNADHGFPRCPSQPEGNIIHAGAFHQAGRDYYVENPGLILLNVDFRSMTEKKSLGKQPLPYDNFFIRKIRETYPFLLPIITTLISPSALSAMPSKFDLNAAHICSHACALSAACAQSDSQTSFRWWCETCAALLE